MALRKGDTVVHVSNGIGTQALLIAKLIGQSGRVYVYNPYEKYVSAIKRSAELNNFEHRLHTYVYAIADHIFEGINSIAELYDSLGAVVKNSFDTKMIKTQAVHHLVHQKNWTLLSFCCCAKGVTN